MWGHFPRIIAWHTSKDKYASNVFSHLFGNEITALCEFCQMMKLATTVPMAVSGVLPMVKLIACWWACRGRDEKYDLGDAYAQVALSTKVSSCLSSSSIKEVMAMSY